MDVGASRTLSWQPHDRMSRHTRVVRDIYASYLLSREDVMPRDVSIRKIGGTMRRRHGGRSGHCHGGSLSPAITFLRSCESLVKLPDFQIMRGIMTRRDNYPRQIRIVRNNGREWILSPWGHLTATLSVGTMRTTEFLNSHTWSVAPATICLCTFVLTLSSVQTLAFRSFVVCLASLKRYSREL